MLQKKSIHHSLIIEDVSSIPQKVYYSRPVELAELDETELDIAGLVLQERLASGGDARGYVFELSKLKFWELDAHDDRWIESENDIAGIAEDPLVRPDCEKNLLQPRLLIASIFFQNKPQF